MILNNTELLTSSSLIGIRREHQLPLAVVGTIDIPKKVDRRVMETEQFSYVQRWFLPAERAVERKFALLLLVQ